VRGLFCAGSLCGCVAEIAGLQPAVEKKLGVDRKALTMVADLFELWFNASMH
jgi:hypothetical protein